MEGPVAHSIIIVIDLRDSAGWLDINVCMGPLVDIVTHFLKILCIQYIFQINIEIVNQPLKRVKG
jgi:hypothetical protein